MNQEDLEKLLEQGLSGDPPRKEFREEVLRESLRTLAWGRRTRARWRIVSLSAAAVLIAAVSFLLGRSSLPRAEVQRMTPVRPVASEGQTVAVPSELVTWLDAARLFRQLGMEDRMARAIDHAHKLRPYDTAAPGAATGPVVAAGGGAVESGAHDVGRARGAGLHESVDSVNRIMALSLGGQDHAE